MTPRHAYIFGGAIGDALLGIQLWRCLDAAHPGARLLVISTRKENSFVEGLFTTVPGIEFIALPKESAGSWLRLMFLALTPHKVVYLEPFRNNTALWWRIMARALALLPWSARLVCSIRRKGRGVLHYSCVSDSLFDLPARVVRGWGLPLSQVPIPRLDVHSKTLEPSIVFQFFAGSSRRSWPYEKAHPLLVQARALYPELEFVLTCGPSEETAARHLAEDITNTRTVAGASALEVLELLSRARLRVGVASGIMHMAAHLPLPSILLCNLSDPCWLPRFNPQALLLSAKENCGCVGDKTGQCSVQTSQGPVYRCLFDIPVEQVLDEMRKALAKNK